MRGLCNKECGRCSLHDNYCGGCSLCEASLCAKNCRRCYALCPERPMAMAYLMSLGKLGIEVKENEEIDIPAHIPIIPDVLKTKPSYEIMTTVGIHAGSMFARNGERINKGYLDRGFAAALNVDERCEGILEFYVRDRTLEGFWDNRKNIYPDLRSMNLKGVIAPNFSVYEDAPRMDHLYNIKRSTVAYNEMLQYGIPAIPDVSWYNKKDLEQWIQEINRNDVKVIAFSFQNVDVQLKASNIWKTYLPGFRYLCRNINPGIKIILIGAASPRRLEHIHQAAAGHRLYILNQSAFVQSRRGMLSDGRRQDKEKRLTLDELFAENLKFFNQFYEQMNEKYSKKAGSEADA